MSGCRNRQDLTFQYPCSVGSPRFARGTAQGFGSPCGQGEPEGGGRQLPFLVNFGAAIGVSPL
jgi:hypothetical protein